MGHLFSRTQKTASTDGNEVAASSGRNSGESRWITPSHDNNLPGDRPESSIPVRTNPNNEPNESVPMIKEEMDKLRYEMAVRLSDETGFQTFMRKTVKPVWKMVFGPMMDILTLTFRPLDVIFREYLLKNMIFEVSDFILELLFLPQLIRELHRAPIVEIVVLEYYRVLETLRIFEDVRRHVNFSLDYAQAVYKGKWSRPLKFYLGGITILAVYTLYIKQLRPWPRHDTKREIDCLHKTVVITGSSSGIGYRLAYEFAKRGAFVIITSPDMVKARKARLDLSKRLMGHLEREKARYVDWKNVRYYEQIKIPCKLDAEFILHNMVEMELNLASTASIYSFTRKIQGMSPWGIDLLINNAAMHAPPEEMVVTDEGKEAHFAVNYFGHFVLTHLLLGELANRKGSRIINITCKKAAESGFINIQKFIKPYLEDEGLPYLPAERGYENSKLALYLFNRHLSKELLRAGLKHVTTYCVCPGVTKTFINRHIHDTSPFRFWRDLAKPFQKKEFHAVQPILHCALSSKVAHESGFFYEDNRRSQLTTRHKDPDRVAESLWRASLAIMGIGHNAMLKLTEQMHIKSHENVFQLGTNMFLHRRDVMTHLLLMEEQTTFKNRHKKFVNERGDARNDFTYFWHGFYLTGGEKSGLLERWVLYNTHPGFRALQREYDIWFECTGSAHFYPGGGNGKMAGLQFMASMPDPLTKEDIEELEELYDSDTDPDDDVEHKERFHQDLIPMDEFIK